MRADPIHALPGQHVEQHWLSGDEAVEQPVLEHRHMAVNAPFTSLADAFVPTGQRLRQVEVARQAVRSLFDDLVQIHPVVETAQRFDSRTVHPWHHQG